ncbi:hypothetical protein EST38_g8549 [Candolleomyces aberdarensis]|uniref:Carbohydrate-binding module family 19 domain-containing protein n=1 Tax=Candolleomyces aberdarensis TaxID=2316362 RepID=A0A4Q2DC82_9AGAR|nr:hypothetical protein EST38_g8549 [Candolleomyces aberdarensis]
MIFKLSTAFVFLAYVAVLAPVKAAPTLIARHEGHDEPSSAGASSSATNFAKQNALDAQKLNAKFKTIKATDSCTNNEMACIDGGFAQCVGGQWQVQKCAGSLRCYALPLVNKAGTSLACDSQEGSKARFEVAGVSGGTDGADASSTPSTEAGDDEDEVEDCDEEVLDQIDEEDLPECDDDEAFPEATSTAANQAAPTKAAADEDSHVYRRQASTIATLPPLGQTAAPTGTVNPATSTSDPVVTPTVVIGTNGIVTVTVVSTVTVSATDCAATSSTVPVASAPTPISVSSAVPSSSSTPIASNTISSSAVSATSPPATVLTSAQTSATGSTIVLTSTSQAAGGLTFTLGTGFATAAAPTGTVDVTATIA